MATVANAQRLVPEFAALSDDDVNLWLADAVAMLNVAAFGSLIDYAVIYLAGHLYLQAQGGAGGSSAAGGPVSNVSDRGWSVGYASPTVVAGSVASGELQETIPGRRYLEIRARAGIGSARVL